MLFVYLATVGLLAAVIALGSRPMRDLPVSEPLLALLAGVVIGPRVLGLVDVPAADDFSVLETATLLLLAVSLMDIALRYPLGDVRRLVRPVAILIVVVMPGMAAVSAGLAAWMLGLPLAAAWLLGSTLAPTDPVLASNVVIGDPALETLPARLRQIVSIEAGANDALALPLVTLGVTIVLGHGLGGWALVSVWEIVAGTALGIGIGIGAGTLVHRERERGRMEAPAFLFFTVTLALFVIGLAQLARVDGLLSVFVSGLAYNQVVTRAEREPEETIEEGVNQFAILPVFAMFGVALPWDAWVGLGWWGLGFAGAVLLLRRPPLVLTLARLVGLSRAEAAFAGWFGPMGIAALYYLSRSALDGALDPDAWAAGTLIVAASTVVHGLTSAPGRQAYARHER